MARNRPAVARKKNPDATKRRGSGAERPISGGRPVRKEHLVPGQTALRGERIALVDEPARLLAPGLQPCFRREGCKPGALRTHPGLDGTNSQGIGFVACHAGTMLPDGGFFKNMG